MPVSSSATLSPAARQSDVSLYLLSHSFLCRRLPLASPRVLSLRRGDGRGRVVIQSQAGCSNHRLLIGFIILTQDLRWERISWPRRAALPSHVHTLKTISHFLTLHQCLYSSWRKKNPHKCACMCGGGAMIEQQKGNDEHSLSSSSVSEIKRSASAATLLSECERLRPRDVCARLIITCINIFKTMMLDRIRGTATSQHGTEGREEKV